MALFLKIFKNVLRLSCSTLNIVLPGLGLALLGRFHLALATQLFLLIITLGVCWSRLITIPMGFTVWLILCLGVIFASTGACWFVGRKMYAATLTHSACLIGVIVANLAFFSTQKHWALGTALYYIPSDSMLPTLSPGDILLVDTWRYEFMQPNYGDVVVFRSNSGNAVVVKRMANWPGGRLLNDDHIYVLGDNPSNSVDSRSFGGVRLSQVIGQGRYTIFNLNDGVVNFLMHTKSTAALSAKNLPPKSLPIAE